MFLVELNPIQITYLADLMDRTPSVIGDKVMLHAQIRQQLNNPQVGEKFVEKVKEEALQEAAKAHQASMMASGGMPMPNQQ